MQKPLLIAVFTVLISITGFGANSYAAETLTVSNIGSSGEDGVDAASDDHLTVSNIGSSGQDGVASKPVPQWIKTSLSYYVDGYTTDEEFLNAVEFLANENIIHVEAEIPFMAGPIPMSDGETEPGDSTKSFDTEMVSLSLSKSNSFFDVFYETYSVDSFFDIFVDLQESTDSFFDVFFEVDTPRTFACSEGQEPMFDSSTNSWKCASANRVDSFFDVFFEVSTESAQNTQDVAELERKIVALEKRIAELESQSGDTVDRSSEYYTP